MLSSSITAMRRTNSAPQLSQNTVLRDAFVKARGEIERGDVQAAVRNLPRHLTDQHDFHKTILRLLDSSPGLMRQEFINEVLNQCPHFDLNAHDKEGKTVLDVAVQHKDQEFARYLLSQGAKPEQVSLGTASPGMQALLTSWRRKNLLYAHFNEESRQSWTPYDQALYEGRHEEVRAQLIALIGSDKVHEVWDEAMHAGMHDVLRAILIVSTPDELRELTKDQYLVGQWKKALQDDPGLSAVLKEFPYQSAKRGKPEDFNMMAKFTGTDEPITCRHLATYQQMQQAQSPRIKFDYKKFSNLISIESNVKPDIKKTYKALKKQASEVHLIDNRRFGHFLARQFEGMEKDGKQSKLMLMESTNHVMNLGLMIKEKNGKKSYVVKFFDPNETTTGTRSKSNNAKTFETQTLASYITDAGALHGYYPEPVGMSLIFSRMGKEAQTSTSTSHGTRIDRTLTSMDIDNIDATVIWHLMSEGFFGNLKQLHGHFTALPEDERIELLAATNAQDYPALFVGMQNGHAEAIKVYGELFKQFESIPENELIKLIAGRASNGYPALFGGMYKGNADVIKAYGELLKLAPPDMQADVLLAKVSLGEHEGKSGLQIALERSKFKASNELVQLLAQLAPDLSSDKRVMLRQELKDYEKTINELIPPNFSSVQEWKKLKAAFSALISALRE